MNASALSTATPECFADKNISISILVNQMDEAWDQFIRHHPAGNHVQTGQWANVKTVQNWQSLLIMLKRGRHILGGAQMLFRPLPLKIAGNIAYIPKGPVFTNFSEENFRLFNRTLKIELKKHHILHLILQPPRCEADYSSVLLNSGFRSSRLSFAPTTTVLIDLQQDLDQILGHMKAKTRYNIRKGERQGITVREGDIEDLKAFHKMLISTAKRQKFPAESESFFLRFWHEFQTRGDMKLFVTKQGDRNLSALLLVTFGETIIYKRGGWFAAQKNLKPNELMHWHAIKWAKAHGFHYYDFEGINPLAAELVLARKPLPDFLKNSIHRFKLGFGGEIVRNPEPFEFIPNRFLRFCYYALFLRILNTAPLKKLLNIFRIS